MSSLANMKFWHITVIEKTKTVFSKKCMTVGEANKLLKEMKEKYPSPQYMVLKENF